MGSLYFRKTRNNKALFRFKVVSVAWAGASVIFDAGNAVGSSDRYKNSGMITNCVAGFLEVSRPPGGRSVHSRCLESRFIGSMNEESALHLVAVEHGPASTPCGVHFVVAIPRELDAWLGVSRAIPIIDAASDTAKVEGTMPSRSELEETVNFEIHEALRPRFHPRDSPTALERAGAFCLCHDLNLSLETNYNRKSSALEQSGKLDHG
jgi:hypothetical protein